MSLSISLHLLARAPVAGRVKTRLIPALGAQGACDLQQLLLERALQLPASGFSERFLWLDDLPSAELQALADAQQALAEGAPLGEHLIRTAHQQLLSFGRGARKRPGSYKVEVKSDSGEYPKVEVAGRVNQVRVSAEGPVLDVAGVGSVPFYTITEFGQTQTTGLL